METRKIRFIGALDSQVQWGGNDDPREFMKEGDIVTLVRQEIHSWHTIYEVEEFPGKVFNSVSFEAV